MASSIDKSTDFVNLSSKITQLLYQRTKNDRDLIKKTLHKLNSINYKYPIVTNPAKAVLLINQCCTLIAPENTELVLPCCELIIKLVTQQNVAIEGRTLTISIQWCLQALKGRSDNVVLSALDVLLRANKNDVNIDVSDKSLVELVELAKNVENLETTLIALQCLEACTLFENGKSQERLQRHLELCSKIFVNHLYNPKSAIDLVHAKIFTVCLRGLQNIWLQNPDLSQENLGIILGIIRTYMLYGIRGIDLIAPIKLLPSTLSIPEPTSCIREKKGGKIAKQRKQRTQAIDKAKRTEEVTSWEYTSLMTIPFTEINLDNVNFDRLPTSDSDFSDSEGGNAAKLTVMAGRVRQAALQLFLQVVKVTEKNVMFSYWSSFIPENSLSGKHNLTTCIIKDPSARGRMTALNVLLLLLISSKVNLRRAEKGERLAFTPFSVTIGLTVVELHKCLMLALKDHSIPVLVQVLKCLATLVQATPYHKLTPGVISEVIENVKPFIYHKDHSVLVTSLIVLGCVLASEPIIVETRKVFVEEIRSEDQSQKNPPVPWILARCLSILGVEVGCERRMPTHTANAVKFESLQIISVMSRNYFADLQAPFLEYITRAIDGALCDKFNDVRFHAGRAADFLGQAMSLYCNTDGDKVISIKECLAFWQTLLKGSLTALLQDEHYSVLRAVGCDCLASMGCDVFEQLTREKQILCITLLFACTRDEENSVRGAAARALGIYVIYPSLREDPGFIVDTAETIYNMLHDDSLTVKIKAAWSLGNLSDALVLNRCDLIMADEVPKNLLLKLLQTTVKSSSDADKIKTNIGRAIGNILQLVTEDLLREKNFRDEVGKAIDVLVKSSTTGSNMKVRWNSCYAISSMMKNSALFTVNIGWQPKVFEMLMELVVNFRNFKVRINAATALSSPAKREFYGQFYQPIWSSLCRALESAQNMEDFSEYKHRDHLVEQICLSLGFLITLIQKDDLGLLQDCVSLHFDFLKEQMRKVWDRLLPEKSTVLFDANSHIDELKCYKNVNQDQRICLQQLSEILKQEF